MPANNNPFPASPPTARGQEEKALHVMSSGEVTGFPSQPWTFNWISFFSYHIPQSKTSTYFLILNISFSGDIQDPPGQGPVQPAVGDPAAAGGLD